MTDGELAAAADALAEVPPSWTRLLLTGKALLAEVTRLRALLAAYGHDPGRCGEFPGGEQCALPHGHPGGCKWASGD